MKMYLKTLPSGEKAYCYPTSAVMCGDIGNVTMFGDAMSIAKLDSKSASNAYNAVRAYAIQHGPASIFRKTLTVKDCDGNTYVKRDGYWQYCFLEKVFAW